MAHLYRGFTIDAREDTLVRTRFGSYVFRPGNRYQLELESALGINPGTRSTNAGIVTSNDGIVKLFTIAPNVYSPRVDTGVTVCASVIF